MTNHLISDVQIGYLLRHGKLLLDQKEMLQSLPRVSSEPVAWFYKDDPYFDGAKWNDEKRLTDSKQLAFWKDNKPVPLYTSPQGKRNDNNI